LLDGKADPLDFDSDDLTDGYEANVVGL